MNSDPVAKWEEILRSHYWDDLLQLAGSNHNKSIHVRFFELERWDPELSRELLERPEQILGAARAALLQIDLPEDISLDGIQVRIIDLPDHFRIEQLNYAHVDRLIAIEGLVAKADMARSKKVSSAILLCLRCGNIFLKELSRVNQEDLYFECPNHGCGRKGPFRPLINNNRYVTTQKIKLQEHPEDIKEGVRSLELDVELEDDLVEKAFLGDRVKINGILKFNPKKANAIKCIDFDLFFKGVSLENMSQEV